MAVLGLRFCARAFSSGGKRGPLTITARGKFFFFFFKGFSYLFIYLFIYFWLRGKFLYECFVGKKRKISTAVAFISGSFQ